jgi:ABC-type antimicrobial peptide transport system permease subunit
MGLLSMSIGVLPLAMLLLGLGAQAVGPTTGVMVSASLGLAALAAWSIRRPEAVSAP